LNLKYDEPLSNVAFKFNVRRYTLVSMIAFQHEFLLVEFEQPSPEMITAVMPPGFERVYGTKKVMEIFDACEGQIEVPSSPEAQRCTWSDYKQRNTWKVLASISPAGAALFASAVYGGRITDTTLTQICGYLDRVTRGGRYAADKGFVGNSHDFIARGADLAMPPKKFHQQAVFTADEARDTAGQANLRIHVERAFARVKKYRFFAHKVCLHQVDMLGKVFGIVFLVGNNYHLPLTNKRVDV
jgi:hypothetical protein